jgi:hypothetical protein
MLHYFLRQDATLNLQLVTDDLLGFRILAPVELRSGSVVLTSCTGSPEWSGLKLRGSRAVSIWPRETQTFYASATRTDCSSSSLLRVTAIS